MKTDHGEQYFPFMDDPTLTDVMVDDDVLGALASSPDEPIMPQEDPASDPLFTKVKIQMVMQVRGVTYSTACAMVKRSTGRKGSR